MTHHLIRAAILTGFAMFIVYADRTGELSLYIAPRMEIYVKLSALGLYAAAIYQIYAALQKRIKGKQPSCDCGHEPSPSILKNTLIYGLFIFPLALGFLMPTGTLGSALAAKKGVSLSGSPSIVRAEAEKTDTSVPDTPLPDDGQPDPQTSEEQLFPYDEYTVDHAAFGKQLYKQEQIEVTEKQFIETLTTLDLYREAFIDKEIQITGFVYREEDMGQQRFAVSRFAMNCCSADALPYGLMIEWPKASDYAPDEWVTVTGKLTIGDYMERPVIMLQATKLERISTPESPYVYPDLDFGL